MNPDLVDTYVPGVESPMQEHAKEPGVESQEHAKEPDVESHRQEHAPELDVESHQQEHAQEPDVESHQQEHAKPDVESHRQEHAKPDVESHQQELAESDFEASCVCTLGGEMLVLMLSYINKKSYKYSFFLGFFIGPDLRQQYISTLEPCVPLDLYVYHSLALVLSLSLSLCLFVFVCSVHSTIQGLRLYLPSLLTQQHRQYSHYIVVTCYIIIYIT